MVGKANKRLSNKRKTLKQMKATFQASKGTGIKKKTKKPVKNSPSTGNKGNRFVKGKSGNPKGRPKGSKNKFSIKDMKAALEAEATRQGQTSTYDYVAQRFFADDHVLISMMKKMLADLKSVELNTTPSDLMSDKEAKEIQLLQEEYAKRCKPKKV